MNLSKVLCEKQHIQEYPWWYWYYWLLDRVETPLRMHCALVFDVIHKYLKTRVFNHLLVRVLMLMVELGRFGVITEVSINCSSCLAQGRTSWGSSKSSLIQHIPLLIIDHSRWRISFGQNCIRIQDPNGPTISKDHCKWQVSWSY